MSIAPIQETTILAVIEDDELRDFVERALIGEGYKVKTCLTSALALKYISAEPFDMIISDFLSIEIDGLNLCKNLRNIFLFRYTPFLILIPRDEPLIRTKALYASTDDVVEKPFSAGELLMRVKAAFSRIERYQDIHPLTKLPGISVAMKALSERIEAKEPIAAAYADLYHLRLFNERYNSHRGNEVLIYTGSLIRRVVAELGGRADFASHFGMDDFFFVTTADAIDTMCQKIIEDFQKTIPSFYDEEDKRHGYIQVKNRKGEILKVPIISIHIGAAANEHYAFTSCAHVLQVTTELKDYAKRFNKSMYVKERRKSYPFP